MFHFRSIVTRTIALHLAAIVATSVLMPLALYLMLNRTALDLQGTALREQADEILRYVEIKPGGALRLDLPGPLAGVYSAAYGRYAYAVLDGGGKVLFSSLNDARPVANTQPGAREPVYFTERRAGATLYGVSLPLEKAGRALTIQVAQDLAHRDVLIDDIVADFFGRVGWITAPILFLLLIIDVAIIRRAMRPLINASSLAEGIGPLHTDLRLPEDGMPREVQPLVRAVNQALDRLDEGFRVQREFTADAAHELRTPLAILRTQIDMIADRDIAHALRHDVEHMSRLVNQLLEMAELETFEIAPDETADLVAVAAEVATFLAPIAVADDKRVAVTGARGPVAVHGNTDMLARALRNLVENALVHTPGQTTVEIAIDPRGTIAVYDRGPGVPTADREQIFARFWRRDRRRQGSSGLGLSIVARIAEQHGARVAVGDRPGGGAVFMLSFPAAAGATENRSIELAAAK